jgi:SPP1 gp7 family putative phage head morphogenesis protein
VSRQLVNIADRYDAELDKASQDVLKRIAAAYDVSYRAMVAKLRDAMPRLQQAGSISTLVRQGAIAAEMGEALKFLNPSNEQAIEQLGYDVIQQAVDLGQQMAGDSLNYIGLQAPFTTIPIGAVRNQAERFRERLVNYSNQQASQISAVVEQGLIQGWGTRKIEGQLKTLGVSFKSNAETIARTETMSAYNGAARSRYEQAGVAYVQWIATPAEGTCSLCYARNTKAWKTSEAPSIPAHPRCRCTYLPTASLSDIDTAFYEDYSKQGLDDLERQGLQPDNGPTYWEKKAGITPAKPSWVPGQAIAKAEPVLKAVNWNPDAIPDLSAKDFRAHILRKQLLADQSSPDATWNKDRKESGLSVNAYKIEIVNAIEAGYVPSNKAIADAKLTKAQIAKVEANRKEQADWSDQVVRVDRAINAPMADDKANRSWKARMSDEEASDYLKDSYFGQMAWYHGNRKDVTDSIANEGAMPERNSRGIYGQGVYFGIDRRIGEQYAGAVTTELDVGILTSHIRAKKPYITNAKDLANMAKNFPGDQSNLIDSVALNQFLRAKGYDSVYLQDLGYGIAFDKRQVVTVRNEDAAAARERRRELTRQKVNDDEEGWVRENSNGRILGRLDRNEKNVDYVSQWPEEDDYEFL